MENIWYESGALADCLELFATEEPLGRESRTPWPPFPRLSQWCVHPIKIDFDSLLFYIT